MKILFTSCATFLIATSMFASEQRRMPSFTVDVQGDGKPVILIPGLACSAEVWDATVAHLNAEHYQTHALTIAGFGDVAPIKSDHLLQSVRDDLAAYIQQNHLDHPVVIGHSLGGFIALWFASTYPAVPGKVISVDGLPFLPAMMDPAATVESSKAAAGQIRQGMLAASPEQYAARQRQTLESMVTSSANVDRELKAERNSDRATVAEAMSELFTNDIRGDLSKITAPVLVLGSWIAYKQYGATHDSSTALYQAQFKNLPSAKIALSDTSKHFIQLDDPDWFYAEIDSFLK